MVYEALDKDMVLDTPYGPLVDEVTVPAHTEKGSVQLEIANPFAMLFLLVKANLRFDALLQRCRPSDGSPCSVAMYTDETTPGNPLRPDKSREAEVVYWTVANLPRHILQ